MRGGERRGRGEGGGRERESRRRLMRGGGGEEVGDRGEGEREPLALHSLLHLSDSALPVQCVAGFRRSCPLLALSAPSSRPPPRDRRTARART